jgi:hypothetical protein
MVFFFAIGIENMDAGDIVAISEGLLLAGTWALVLRVKRKWSGWREKAALWGFLCASVAIVADLILTVVMHFRGESTFAALLFLATVIAGVLLGFAGFVLGILGRGTPRFASLAWSSVTLLSLAATAVLTVSQ